MIYTKPPLSIEDQLILLKEKGLILENEERAKKYFSFISYYRFSGYFLPLQKADRSDTSFLLGTTFDQVLQLYIFDRKLRLLTIDVLERIETAFKTVVLNEMALACGSHWYLDSDNFRSFFKHSDFIKILKKETCYNNPKKQNQACKHYYSKYKSPKFPPIWVIADALSLGTFSIIFQNLDSTKIQKRIAKQFDLSPMDLSSWMHSLTTTRNICAHHGRFWNKTFVITPSRAKRLKPLLSKNSKFFAQAVMIQDLLLSISNNPSWSKRLYDLLQECPLDIHAHMGFPAEWEKDKFWKIEK